MSQVRPLASEDISAVAALFQRTFVDRRRPPPTALASALSAAFLHHPWQDEAIVSRVHVDDAGAINGFIGALPVRLVADGRPVRAAVASSLMVDTADPLAGAKLLRTFLKGPQELSLSETANPVARRMWERAGGVTLDGLSLDWIRVFRPARATVALAAAKIWAAELARPFAALADRIARRVARDILQPPALADSVTGAEERAQDVVDHLIALTERRSLRPAWDPQSLHWFIREAETKARRGAFHNRVARAGNGEVLGCTLYHAKPRGLGYVLHFTATPGAEEAVLADLLQHTDAIGLAALLGRVTPAWREALVQSRALLFRRSATVAHSRNPGLLAALNDSGAVVTGLAAESWTRLIG